MNSQDEVIGLLRDSLSKSKQKNKRVSLRGYARKLGLAPSVVSSILSGKRQITLPVAKKILTGLGVEKSRLESICKNLKFRYSQLDIEASLDDRDYHELKSVEFAVLADWQHFAILSLMNTKDFKSDVEWIARRLGISIDVASACVERLQKVGLIKWKDGDYNLTRRKNSTTTDILDVSIQESHRQHLKLAEKALGEVEIEWRDLSGITMAIDPKKIPEAKRRIRAFRRSLCRFLEQGEATEVFSLNIQLFPLTKMESK